MILHVSAQRFCCRNRVARVRAPWGAKSAREKYKGSDGTAKFGLLRDPSFLGSRMHPVMYLFVFLVILKKYPTENIENYRRTRNLKETEGAGKKTERREQEEQGPPLHTQAPSGNY